MTENPTAAGLSEADMERLDHIVHVQTFQTDTIRNIALFAAVESIVTAHVTAAEDRMREAVEVCDQVEANPVGWGGDIAVSLARTIRAALAPTAHDAATMPEVGQ